MYVLGQVLCIQRLRVKRLHKQRLRQREVHNLELCEPGGLLYQYVYDLCVYDRRVPDVVRPPLRGRCMRFRFMQDRQR